MIFSDTCEVELCGKPIDHGLLCAQHRKKEIAGALEYDRDGTIWDTCARGHRWTEANTHWESNSKGGKRRRCKKCLAIKAQRKKEEPQVVLPPQPVQPDNEEMRQAIQSTDKALKQESTPCADNYEQWADYTAETMPSAEAADAMCKGCWFFEGCGNNAAAIKPGWGVWGGERWAYGKKFNDENGILDDDD